MIFFRLYTAADTYTDYDKIWSVGIAPQEISGATFWQQECRTASFSMPYEAVFESYWNDENKPPIYRLLGELWEEYTYADPDGEIRNHKQRLFKGWLFQDSFQIETVGITAAAVQRIMTITLKDYLSVIEYCLTHAWQLIDASGALQTINLTETLLPYDSSVSIEGIYQDVWVSMPVHATDPAYPLWVLPALENTLETYPGYGYTYNGVTLFVQQDMPLGVDWADARIYQDTDGQVFFEEVRLRWASPLWFYRYRYVWNKYLVTGSRLTLVPGHPVVLEGLWLTALADYNPGYVTTVLTGEDWTALPGDPHNLTITVANNTITYRVNNGEPFADMDSVYRRKLTITGSVNYTHFITLPEPETTDSEDTAEEAVNPGGAYSWLAWTDYLTIYEHGRGWFPAWAKPTNTEVKGWTVPTLDLFSFALLVNFAWLREYKDVWRISNRLFLSQGMDVTNLSDAKLISYSDSHDFNPGNYNGGIECFVDNAAYVSGINSFASRIYQQINRVCRFSCNREVGAGDYVTLPYVGSGYPIQITSVEYDPATPQVWGYTGRSY